MGGWRRVLTGMGLAAAGLLLAGCRAEGTFDILSEDRIAVDLTITDNEIQCPGTVDALKLTVTTITDASGAPACHVTGTTQATYFSPFGIDVSTAEEYLVLDANISGSRSSWPASDITVRFPGLVQQASRGAVSGNAVRITDLGALAEGSGLRVVALDRPGPPDWVLGALAGAAVGLAFTATVVALARWTRRRLVPPRRVPTGADVEPAQVAPDGAPTSPDGAEPPESATSEPLADTSWLARPPPEPVATVQGDRPDARSAGARTNPDHSIWAPPEDQG